MCDIHRTIYLEEKVHEGNGDVVLVTEQSQLLYAVLHQC